jgi:hypothetical protein
MDEAGKPPPLGVAFQRGDTDWTVEREIEIAVRRLRRHAAAIRSTALVLRKRKAKADRSTLRKWVDPKPTDGKAPSKNPLKPLYDRHGKTIGHYQAYLTPVIWTGRKFQLESYIYELPAKSPSGPDDPERESNGIRRENTASIPNAEIGPDELERLADEDDEIADALENPEAHALGTAIRKRVDDLRPYAAALAATEGSGAACIRGPRRGVAAIVVHERMPREIGEEQTMRDATVMQAASTPLFVVERYRGDASTTRIGDVEDFVVAMQDPVDIMRAIADHAAAEVETDA